MQVKFNTWENNNAILFTKYEENVVMFFKDLVKQHKWNIKYTYENVEELKKINFDFRLIIIDDNIHFFSSYILRNLCNELPLLLMPKIIFISEDKTSEYNLLKNISSIILIKKPIIPLVFHSALNKLLKEWSTGLLAMIKKACEAMLIDNQATALKLINEVHSNVSLHHLTTPVIASYYLKLSQITNAEKILLSSLKLNPKDPILLLKLANFYMKYGCINLAKKILVKMQNIYGNSMFFLLDLLQSYLLSDNLSEAITITAKILDAGFDTTYMSNTMCKLLYTEGRISEIENYLKNSKIKLTQLTTAWEKDINLTAQPQSELKSA